MLSRLLASALFLLCIAVAPLAQERSGAIHVLAAWTRATPGPTAAVYLDLRNDGAETDRLVGASTPEAERIELHEHRSAGGVMSMATLPEIALRPGETVQLRPGGTHLMLFGLKRPVRPGDRLALTLIFEKAGEIPLEVVAGTAGALAPPS